MAESQQYRRQLEAVCNNATVALFIMDAQQHCTYMNPAAERLTGYSLTEVQGRPLHEVVHHTRPDGTRYPLAECPIDRAFPERNCVQGEEIFVHKDGHFYPVAFTASPIRQGDQVVGTIIEVRSIAEQRQAQEALLQSNQRFRFLAESMPQKVFTAQPDGQLAYVNPQWCEFTGLSSEALCQGGWLRFVHADDLAENLRRWRHSVETGAFFELEHRVRRADGVYRWHLSRAHPMRDAHDQILMWVGSNTDIDDVKRAEERLRQSEQRYRMLAEANPIGIVHGTVQGAVTYCNQAYCQITGFGCEEFLSGQVRWLDITPPEWHTLDLEQIASARAAGFCPPYQKEFVRKDGRRVPVLVGFAYLDEARESMVAFVADLSAQKQSEERWRAGEALLSAVLDSLPVSIIIGDQTGRLVRMNRASREIWGPPPMSPSIEAYRDWVGYWPETGRRVAPDEWPLSRAVLQGESLSGVRIDIDRFDDGSRRHLELSAAPVRNEQGMLLGGVVACLDVTERVRAEEQTRRGEALLSAVLDALPVGVVIADPSGRIVRDNAANRELWGVPPETTSWEQYGDWVAYWPDSGRRIEAHEWALARALLQGEVVRGELVECQRFGTQERRLYLNNAAPVRDASGTILAGVAAEQDVTERIQIARALQESEQQLRTLADNMDQLAWMADATGAVFWFNRRWFDYTGTTLEAMRGWGWTEVLPPESRERVLGKLRHCLATGQPWEDTFPLRGQPGRSRWFLARAVPIHDPAGALVRWFGTGTDVTELRQVEDALRRRERELQTLTDNSPDILTRFDRQLRYLFVNAAIEAATGHPPESFIGRTNRELGMPPALCDLWDTTIQAVFADGQPRSIEFRSDAMDRPHHYSARFVAERTPTGAIESVLGVTVDVTERKQMEEALREADRKKDEFLATLAHELRNPLAPIRNGLQILRLADGEATATAEARVMMERQLAHLVRLVDDLLDVSRVSRGKITLKRERVTLQSVLASALEASQPLIEAGAHALVVHQPDQPVWLDGDLTRLAQVVANLLNNAAKYTPDGGRIELTGSVDAGQAVIQVCDNGSGIPRALLPHIFEMFTQANRTLDRAQGGLGIGLSLVQRLVHLHGGTVGADSPGEGQGSTFTVQLPLASAPPAGALPPPEATSRGRRLRRPRTGPACRVLVVDDNPDAARSLAIVLQMLGHQVHVAHGGAEALQLASGIEPDLIFLDLGMPGLDGYEVCRRLRATDLGARCTIVALTGWGAEADKLHTRAVGFDAHLVKPVDPDQIQAILGRVSPCRDVPGIPT